MENLMDKMDEQLVSVEDRIRSDLKGIDAVSKDGKFIQFKTVSFPVKDAKRQARAYRWLINLFDRSK